MKQFLEEAKRSHLITEFLVDSIDYAVKKMSYKEWKKRRYGESNEA